jgi:hypothetical protein
MGASLQIAVDVLPVRQVVRDGAVNLFEAQNGKCLRDRLGRLARHEGMESSDTRLPLTRYTPATLIDVGVAHRFLASSML